jgi:hypothetical protein
MLIDPYFIGKPFRNSKNLDSELKKYYDVIVEIILDNDIRKITPRYRFEHGLKIGFRDIFYYIDRLYDNNPSSVIDVGCGECIWKKWFPNIIGFDPTPSIYSNYDFIDYFDQDFCQGHQKNWDCGMALNSIHFVPWTSISDQINMAMNLIKDGGRFLFTFNFQMLDKNTDESVFPKNSSMMEKINFMDNIISSTGFKIIMIDYPYLQGIDEKSVKDCAHINGNVRFILEK